MAEVKEDEEKTGINWVQVAGAALAAVSSAVLLSTLGVAGTIIGAALGSVVASVGSAVYTRTLDASRQQVAAQAAALRRVTQARAQVNEAVRRGAPPTDTGLRRASRDLTEAEEALEEAQHAAPTETEPQDGAATWARRLPWKRIAIVAAGVFLVAMVAITAFEMLTGRAVSVYTGGSDSSTGSTVPGLRDRGDDPARDTTPTPLPSATLSDGPSTGPTEGSGTPTPGETSTPTQTPEESPTTEPPTTTEPSPSSVPTTPGAAETEGAETDQPVATATPNA